MRWGAARTPIVILALMGVAATAFSSAAYGAPPWDSPTILTPGPQGAGNQQVALDAHGDAYAVWWNTHEGVNAIEASFRPLGGEWSSPVALTQEGLSPKLAVDEAGEAVVAWETQYAGEGTVEAALRASAGEWQAPVVLSTPGTKSGDPTAAIGDDGVVAVAWTSSHGGNAPIVEGALHAGGSWQPAEAISHPELPIDASASPQVGVDGDGEAIISWQQEGAWIEGATHPLDGSWSTPLKLSDLLGPSESYSEPALAMNPSGAVVVLWCRENDLNEQIVESAQTPAPDSAWRPPKKLSAFGVEHPVPRVAIDADGEATAVWEQRQSTGNASVDNARMSTTGSWSSALTLSAPGESAEKPEVAVNPSGDAVVVWSRLDGKRELIQAETRSPGGDWQEEATISTVAYEQERPSVAIDPQGDAVAAWSRENPEVEDTNQVLVAAYDATGLELNGLAIPSTGSAGQALSFAVAPFDAWSPLKGTSWSFGDGAIASGTSVTHAYTAGGTYTVTVTSENALGETAGAIGTLTVAPSPGVGSRPPNVIPVLSDLRESAKRWREGRLPAHLSTSAETSVKRPPLGTTFSFDLDGSAQVTFTFTQTQTGRRQDGRCVKQTRQNTGNERCTHTVVLATLAFAAHEGTDRVRFQGLISKHRRLRPGTYALSARAAGQAHARSLRFTITR